MDIKYLTQLKNNPVVSWPNNRAVFTLSPISMDEILTLESTYNNGDAFPAALRELLFLAGKSCYVLDYGVDGNRSDMQKSVRHWLTERNKRISRPFFAIDVYNAYDQFLFVYLDENVDDPLVQQALLFCKSADSSWIDVLDYTLSEFIDGRMDYLLSGYNPF